MSATSTGNGDREVIRTIDLTKVYSGSDFAAVDELNLSVHRGEIFGLLGPNGAGKTTTAGMLATKVIPTSGSAFVGGVDVVAHPATAKQLIGTVSQTNTLDRQLTVSENLDFHGRLFGISAADSRATAERLLEQFQLSDWAGASPASERRGNAREDRRPQRRRAGALAQAVAVRACAVVDACHQTAGVDHGECQERRRHQPAGNATWREQRRYGDGQLCDALAAPRHGGTAQLGGAGTPSIGTGYLGIVACGIAPHWGAGGFPLAKAVGSVGSLFFRARDPRTALARRLPAVRTGPPAVSSFARVLLHQQRNRVGRRLDSSECRPKRGQTTAELDPGALCHQDGSGMRGSRCLE